MPKFVDARLVDDFFESGLGNFGAFGEGIKDVLFEGGVKEFNVLGNDASLLEESGEVKGLEIMIVDQNLT